MKDDNKPSCKICDHAPACRKHIQIRGKTVLAREQETIVMSCICIVEDICRDCLHFAGKRCAAWRVRYGKRNPIRLIRCPKRIEL